MNAVMKKGIALSIALLCVGCFYAPSAGASSTSTQSDVDTHTRAYVKQVRGCVAIASLSLQIASKQNDFKASATLKSAADTCDAIRHRLVGMSTDHFSKQADVAWGGVDRIKSGLNAFVAYIDSGAPSKLNEAVGKVKQGTSWTQIGIRGINLRRHVYGLGSI
jgi:hypothetical protein